MTETVDPPVATAPGEATETFESLDPATGRVVGTHPVATATDVDTAVARAEDAAGWWAGLTFAQRRDVLLDWRRLVTRRMDDLVELVHAETGKPRSDARLEIVLAIDHIAWAARHAGRVLRPRRVNPGLLMANHAASVERRPLGVVGVIGPWNYPVFTPIGSIVYALAAGNTVVFKPSEHTPGVGVWLAETLSEVAGRRDLLQTMTGLGETGRALCRADIDKLAFTGSSATGRAVMAACAENLTPVLIEAGGKDAMLVDSDADLPAAAEAALWGGMSNAGQTCIGIERVYVHERVHDDFVAELTAQAQGLRAEPGGKIGPITMPSQLDVIRRHLQDALGRGARAVLGGADAVGERYVQPTILTHVPEDSAAITEETFGPTLTVNPVRDMDEAVERANATAYGLAGAVFAQRRGMELARRMRSGMTSVNAVIAFAGVPSLPFGGVGDSGFGRIHGPEGLREFTSAKAITRQRVRPPLLLTSFARTERTDRLAERLIRALHGR